MSTKTLNKVKKVFDHFVERDGIYSAEKNSPKLPKLPSGIYQVKRSQSGKIIYVPMQALTDGLVTLPVHQSETVIKELAKFWTKETRDKFDKYGLVYKRGVLMYGPPGSGKSVTVSKIMDQVVSEGGLVFFETDPVILFEAANEIKSIQGDIKVLAVYEEFDAWLAQSHQMLSLLDGELQIDNVVFLATTNYIDRIPPRIKNRPSRFATVLEIGAPNAETRRAFLEGKIGEDETVDIPKWVKLTNGFMLDHLKDLIISVLCIGLSLEEAIDKLKSMNTQDLRDEEDDYADKDIGDISDDVLYDPEIRFMLGQLGKLTSKRKGYKI